MKNPIARQQVSTGQQEGADPETRPETYHEAMQRVASSTWRAAQDAAQGAVEHPTTRVAKDYFTGNIAGQTGANPGLSDKDKAMRESIGDSKNKMRGRLDPGNSVLGEVRATRRLEDGSYHIPPSALVGTKDARAVWEDSTALTQSLLSSPDPRNWEVARALLTEGITLSVMDAGNKYTKFKVRPMPDADLRALWLKQLEHKMQNKP